jgi:hypothetical protein
MSTVRIEGNKNIANTGVIYGDCNVNSTIINLKFSITDIYKIFAMNDNEKEKSLVNMTEAQKKLAEAIDKFAQAELARAESGKVRDEADKLRAEADKNNSIANLNYSKIMLEDREIIKQLMDKLK